MSPKLLNILLIMLPVALYFGYLDPMYNGTPGLVWTPEKSISLLKAENVQYSNSINQVDLIQKMAGDVDKEYKAINPELVKKVNTLLPESIDPIKLRNDIVSIAAKSGIAVSGLSVIQDPRDSTAYRVNFSIKARYGLFKNFMENYEKSTRLFILNSLVINQVKPDKNGSIVDLENDEGKLNISVISKVYFKKK